MKLNYYLPLFVLGVFFGINHTLSAQSSGVAISEDQDHSAHSSAILDVESTTKGILIPRMTEAQKNAIANPQNGLLVYQSDNTAGFYYYNGSTWTALAGGGGGSGNYTAGDGILINGATISNSKPGKWTDANSGSIYFNDSVSINKNTAPTAALDVGGSIRLDDELNKYNGSTNVLAIDVTTSGSGFLSTFGTNGNSNVVLSSLNGDDNKGWFGIRDETGDTKAIITILKEGLGYINLNGPNGNSNVQISASSSNTNNGSISIFNADGNSKVFSSISDSGNGFIRIIGENGNDNIQLSTLSGHANNGFVNVLDADGKAQAQLYVDENGVGQVWASGTKNFKVPHPNDDSKEIWYAALEGPEAAMYIRGTSKLENGTATIALPDHFTSLAVEKSMTVIITPLSADSKGLAVTSKKLSGIEVKELFQGNGSYEFDWEVKCVRNGFEDYQPVRPKPVNETSDLVPLGEGGLAPGENSIVPTASPRKGSE
ncbi:hypothetical protein [Flexithrix dorotheae]|uniref:hypothetical protein n=1 Tax=Flexithrix dorotheae TaxID=70993 RepID=UPI0003682820|nr:hypothetical protein [Flexithrix dorotheae]